MDTAPGKELDLVELNSVAWLWACCGTVMDCVVVTTEAERC